MKLIETLTQTQLSQIAQKQANDLFQTIFQSGDACFKYQGELCFGYYLINSANKSVAPFYINMLELYNEGKLSSDYTINVMVGDYIRSKYVDKWARDYKLLIDEQYEVLYNRVYNETETITYDTSKGKTGNNADTTTYNIQTTTDGKQATNETTERSASDESGLYGFASAESVGNETNTSTVSETVKGAADDNTTHTETARTGSDGRVYAIDESETHKGTDTHTIEKMGREGDAADLIEKELALHAKRILFDIIYKDIDKILTLPIY